MSETRQDLDFERADEQARMVVEARTRHGFYGDEDFALASAYLALRAQPIGASGEGEPVAWGKRGVTGADAIARARFDLDVLRLRLNGVDDVAIAMVMVVDAHLADAAWQATRLRSALDNWGRHHSWCTMTPCNCGLSDAAALSAPQREAAPAVSEGMALAAMREESAQMGESFDAMWSAMSEQDRATAVEDMRHVLQAALSVSERG